MVKVKKEFYYALENVNKWFSEGEEKEKLKILIEFTENKMWRSDKYKELNNHLLSEIIYLLYKGYELEETKEEQLLRIYKDHDNHYAYGAGIKKTLEILDYQIEGITK